MIAFISGLVIGVVVGALIGSANARKTKALANAAEAKIASEAKATIQKLKD